MSFVPKMLFVIALLSGMSTANAAIVFSGFDPAGSPFTNSNAANSSFTSGLTGLGVENFESYMFFPPLGFYTTTGNGNTFTSNWTSANSHPSPIPLVPTGNGFDSAKLNGNVILNDVFNFSTPIRSFGTYITNIGDDDNITTLSVNLDFSGSNPRTINIPITFSTGVGQGFTSTAFIGIIVAAPFNNVTFVRGGSNGPDILLYDNITVSAIPEPGTWALLSIAVGLAGVFGLRRRQAAA